jgi:hypothetical protein
VTVVIAMRAAAADAASCVAGEGSAVGRHCPSDAQYDPNTCTDSR